jgi:hypothetical protein
LREKEDRIYLEHPLREKLWFLSIGGIGEGCTADTSELNGLDMIGRGESIGFPSHSEGCPHSQ